MCSGKGVGSADSSPGPTHRDSSAAGSPGVTVTATGTGSSSLPCPSPPDLLPRDVLYGLPPLHPFAGRKISVQHSPPLIQPYDRVKGLELWEIVPVVL